MKSIKLISLAVATACATSFTSCGDKNETPQPENEQILFGGGTQIGNGEQSFEIRGAHVISKGTYLLKGWVYVTNGASLSIEAGTVIKGDKDTKAALIVEPGGKIFAEGTASQPIVFTSEMPAGQRKPGDWGGLVICGRANNNNKAMIIEGGPRTTHGGNDDDDNSGIISYVRVEFAGYPFKTDQEINGITFGSVGRGTQVDHIQVSCCNDDSYEWFGGTVNCKYLVAYHGWDDDFDTDNGFSGKLQFMLGVRHPKIADTSLSNGFESDNNADGTGASPNTSCIFSNVTLVGPLAQAADFANTTDYINGGGMNPENGSKTGTFQAAMHLRRNSALNCFNSVALGYPVGLILDNEKGSTQTRATDGEMNIKNVFFAGMAILGSDVNKSWKDVYSDDGKTMNDESAVSFSHSYFLSGGLHNSVFETVAELALSQPNSMAPNPNWGPTAGSPLLGAASFDDDKLSSGFDKVSYIGAFAGASDADNWMKDWTNFDPQNEAY
jgi:hypothetical protein